MTEKTSPRPLPEFRRAGHGIRSISIGDRKIITHGMYVHLVADLYHYAMTASWVWFFGVFAGLFVSLNGFFALLYWITGDAIANPSPPGYWGAFFFSVETLATVGYGDMHPATVAGHIIATTEIFIGTSSVAMITGVMFARFSRPRARILFANHPVVHKLDGKETMVIRIANARPNVVVDAGARLRLLRNENTAEGTTMRRLHDLTLVRDQHPMFLLGWSIMHVIDESSPLFGQTPEALADKETGFVLSITGIDETTSQTIRARGLYAIKDIRWGHRYHDVLYTDPDGQDHIDYARFHETDPIST